MRRGSDWPSNSNRPILGFSSMDLLSVAPWHYKWLLAEGCQTLFICMNKYFDTCHHYGSLASMPTMSSAVLRRVSDCSIIRPIIGCQSQPFFYVWHLNITNGCFQKVTKICSCVLLATLKPATYMIHQVPCESCLSSYLVRGQTGFYLEQSMVPSSERFLAISSWP